MKTFSITGNVVDILQEIIYPGEIIIENGLIKAINKLTSAKGYILPGFIDSHIHIESSMLSPLEFSKIAVKHGTVAVVSDPHEIANVLGIEGINFMIRNAALSPLKFLFGAPSCVPATPFESSGATIDSMEINDLLKRSDIYFLSEMMNFPGVLFNDSEVLKKIESAKSNGKPVDGHAPGLTGLNLKKYIQAGISTDHESLTYEEAVEKIKQGMMIQIREGSASKSFETFKELIEEFSDQVMLCSDDLHPEDLIHGHINLLLKRGIQAGINPFKLFKIAILNPIKHYNLPVGFLQIGQPADLVLADNLESLNILATYINGEKVFDTYQGISFKNVLNTDKINKFLASPIGSDSLIIKCSNDQKMRVIEIIDRQLVTKEIVVKPKLQNDVILSDPDNDILKIAVVNRYEAHPSPAIGFVHGFGLKYGAIASSISHDSHNIVAIGTNDEDLVNCINTLISLQGGIVFSEKNRAESMSLPIAGLMSDEDAFSVANRYRQIETLVKQAGSNLTAPLMTMAFLALIVIPDLKISDKGLFDVNSFKFVFLLI